MIKLIKHDLKSILPDFIGFYIALFALATVFPFLLHNLEYQFIIVLYVLASFGTVIAITVLSYVAIFNLFNKRLFSHQGYLTLSLPVKTRTLLLSKIVSALVILMLTGIVMMISFAAMMVSAYLFFNTQWAEVEAVYRLALESNFFGFMAQVFAAITPITITNTLYSLTLLLFVISFVHTSFIRKNRVLVGVLLYVGIGFLINTLVGNVFNLEFMDAPLRSMPRGSFSFDNDTLTIPWMQILLNSVFMLLLSVGFFELTHYLMKHKLEIE